MKRIDFGFDIDRRNGICDGGGFFDIFRIDLFFGARRRNIRHGRRNEILVVELGNAAKINGKAFAEHPEDDVGNQLVAFGIQE